MAVLRGTLSFSEEMMDRRQNAALRAALGNLLFDRHTHRFAVGSKWFRPLRGLTLRGNAALRAAMGNIFLSAYYGSSNRGLKT